MQTNQERKMNEERESRRRSQQTSSKGVYFTRFNRYLIFKAYAVGTQKTFHLLQPYLIFKVYVVGTQKNRLSKTILLVTTT